MIGRSKISEIHSIKELLENLDPNKKDIDQYFQTMKNIAFGKEELEFYCHWSNCFYTRNLIARNSSYELIALCWEKNQYSPIHNHQGQDCWMYVVEGTMKEVWFHPTKEENGKIFLQEGKQEILSCGLCAYITDDMALHLLKNNTDQRAITLHLYSLPIEECNIYCAETGKVVRRKLCYYSIDGKKVCS